ncbi:MAG: SurA N-terminal domain-containing protein [Nitrospiraceae bacterium]|nr:SurA N-terminal domain-containing protein [Nitrospiraceae bacterium]
MLQSMRKHARFFYVLFFIVILSFVFWGIGTVDQDKGSFVAEIGNIKISQEEYWRSYERMREFYREMNKGQFTEEMEKKMKLKESLLNAMVEDKVLLIAAQRLGVAVSEKELKDAITTDPQFMRDGIFRQDVYFRALQLMRMTPEIYETKLKQQLTALKMKRLIWTTVDTASNDALASALAKNDQAALEQLLFSKRNMAVKSYVESLKNSMKVKINKDLIS